MTGQRAARSALPRPVGRAAPLVMAGPAPPLVTLVEFKAWARIDDTIDDEAILDGIDAASQSMSKRLRWPDASNVRDYLPDDLRMACFIRVLRSLSRRNSPDGVVGFADAGGLRVSSRDPDIQSLENPYRPAFFA
jgi:Phage gp6-like head-tail connector protein